MDTTVTINQKWNRYGWENWPLLPETMQCDCVVRTGTEKVNGTQTHISLYLGFIFHLQWCPHCTLKKADISSPSAVIRKVVWNLSHSSLISVRWFLTPGFCLQQPQQGNTKTKLHTLYWLGCLHEVVSFPLFVHNKMTFDIFCWHFLNQKGTQDIYNRWTPILLSNCSSQPIDEIRIYPFTSHSLFWFLSVVQNGH